MDRIVDLMTVPQGKHFQPNLISDQIMWMAFNCVLNIWECFVTLAIDKSYTRYPMAFLAKRRRMKIYDYWKIDQVNEFRCWMGGWKASWRFLFVEKSLRYEWGAEKALSIIYKHRTLLRMCSSPFWWIHIWLIWRCCCCCCDSAHANGYRLTHI